MSRLNKLSILGWLIGLPLLAQLWNVINLRPNPNQVNQPTVGTKKQCVQLQVMKGFIGDLSAQQYLVYNNLAQRLNPQLSFQDQQKEEIFNSDVNICKIFQNTVNKCYKSNSGRKMKDSLPPGWDWRAYLQYYPEISMHSGGDFNEMVAMKHYTEIGQYNNYIPRKVHVVVRYTVCSGLVNQQYGHISALTLAMLLGAKLIMPPSLKRQSFNSSYFDVPWRQLPLSKIIDTNFLIKYWKKQGLEIKVHDMWQNIPRIENGDEAFWEDMLEGFSEKEHVRLNGIYRRPTSMLDLLFRVRLEVLSRYQSIISSETGSNNCPKGIVVDLPCTFFSLQTHTAMPLISEVTQSLKFSSYIRGVAQQIINKLRAEWGNFNGVHLRAEKDAEDWMNAVGGWSRYIDYYLATMIKAGLNQNTGLYLATGLLTYNDFEGYNNITSMLTELKLANQTTCKELILDKQTVKNLEPEISAAIDLMVMLESDIFIGLDPSTFSFYIRELRKLAGIPIHKSVLVKLRDVGTTSLFEEAAVLS